MSRELGHGQQENGRTYLAESAGSTKSLSYSESEVVIGLVYAVGTDVQRVLDTTADVLKQFRYSPQPVKLSSLIMEMAARLSWPTPSNSEGEQHRIATLMDLGNKFRKLTADSAILAKAAIAKISEARASAGNGPYGPLPKSAHLILSLKRPEEVELLREVYGSGFYLVGVYASELERIRFLNIRKGIPHPGPRQLINRDENEEEQEENKSDHGQKFRDTFQMADVFISLEAPECDKQISRFLDLVFGHPHVTPTDDEHAMFLAYSASLRSGQLARQVGASVVSEDGDVVALGCNDVPRSGGGLYSEDSKPDHRDHLRKSDPNDIERSSILKDVLERLESDLSVDDALKKLRGARIMDISEFGRAVHAEMEAILCCTRSGVSTRGATLFCTTFPCHNCARHIIAAGFKRVVYIEPYPKSMAAKLHSDSIEIAGADAQVSAGEASGDDRRIFSGGRVTFEHFVGIGPRRFFDLFSMKLSGGSYKRRKHKDGRVVSFSRKDARLRVEMIPSSYIDREQVSAAIFKGTFDSLQENENGIRRNPFPAE